MTRLTKSFSGRCGARLTDWSLVVVCSHIRVEAYSGGAGSDHHGVGHTVEGCDTVVGDVDE